MLGQKLLQLIGFLAWDRVGLITEVASAIRLRHHPQASWSPLIYREIVEAVGIITRALPVTMSQSLERQAITKKKQARQKSPSIVAREELHRKMISLLGILMLLSLFFIVLSVLVRSRVIFDIQTKPMHMQNSVFRELRVEVHKHAGSAGRYLIFSLSTSTYDRKLPGPSYLVIESIVLYCPNKLWLCSVHLM